VGNSERTFVEVRSVAELLADARVDWVSLGAVFAAQHALRG
jgi:hypothetical protein